MAELELRDLTKHFGSVVAVDGVDLHVEDGEFVCLLGPSGCGKSTALRMVSGFERPTRGDIVIDDTSVVALQPNKRPTALVFQQYTLWPHMTVRENIAFGLKLRRLSRSEIRAKVAESLELVGLAGYEDRKPSQLSGGQQQRVALARAVVLEPKILLLDEPFSSLDASLRVRLREEVKRIQRQLGITTIFVTHDQEEAMSLADRLAVMNQGRIEQLAPPAEVYSSPRSLFVAEFIGEMNLIDADVEAGGVRLGGRFHAADGVQPLAGPARLAIRPEEIEPVEPGSNGVGALGPWAGVIEQSMDLGHYRKVFVRSDEVGELKVFLPKSRPVAEGERIHLRPERALLYVGDEPPVELRGGPAAGRPAPDGAPPDAVPASAFAPRRGEAS